MDKGSCDTEDWSNDTENSTLHHRNKLHFKIYSNRAPLYEIVIIMLHNITDFTLFLNADLVSVNSFKNIKYRQTLVYMQQLIKILFIAKYYLL